MKKIVSKIFKRIGIYIKKPGDIFRFGSPRFRGIYTSLSIIFRKKEMRERFFNAKDDSASELKTSGFTKIQHAEILSDEFRDLLDAAIKYSNEKIDHYLETKKQNSISKIYLQSCINRNEFFKDDPLISLALSDWIVSKASSYLNMIPIVGSIQVWYSPNESKIEEGSQFFHLDYADVNQCKVFINLDTIDEDSGPLTFVPKEKSEKITKSINYKLSNKDIRISDDVVLKHCDKKEWIKSTGEKGDILMVDSSRCIHFGSRAASKPRRILMIQYITPFSFTLPLNYRGKTFLSPVFEKSLKTSDKHSRIIGI